MSDNHEAAILSSKGSPLAVSYRKTTTPGPNEIVVKVKSIALNPVDHIQQSMGFNIKIYPYVLGCDVAGTIHSWALRFPTLQ